MIIRTCSCGRRSAIVGPRHAEGFEGYDNAWVCRQCQKQKEEQNDDASRNRQAPEGGRDTC